MAKIKRRKITKRLLDKFLELLRADTYTIKEICESLNISRTSYYEIKNNDPIFAESVKNAIREREERLSAYAKKSLMERVKGFNIIETKVITMPDKNNPGKYKIKEKIITEKHIPADINAIIFVLTNFDPATWKKNRTFEIISKGANNPLKDITDEELNKRIKVYEMKIKNKDSSPA